MISLLLLFGVLMFAFLPFLIKWNKVPEEKLYVISCVSNPVKWGSRYRLYHEFKNRMLKEPQVEFYTVELARGKEPFHCTETHNSNHLQLRSDHVMWHKENMLNLLVQRLPRDWKYLAWVDADIEFMNPNWVVNTITALQTYEIIQPWERCMDLGPNNEILNDRMGYCAGVVQNFPKISMPVEYGAKYHPGFAWACTRKFWDTVGGLLDFSILGSADDHMAKSFIGKGEESCHGKICEAYKNKVKAWQSRAYKFKDKIGYIPGTVKHYWHGAKKNRQYVTRWQVLIRHDYNPDTDIFRDWQGLYQLTDSKPGLKQDLENYFLARQEDSTEIK